MSVLNCVGSTPLTSSACRSSWSASCEVSASAALASSCAQQPRARPAHTRRAEPCDHQSQWSRCAAHGSFRRGATLSARPLVVLFVLLLFFVAAARGRASRSGNRRSAARRAARRAAARRRPAARCAARDRAARCEHLLQLRGRGVAQAGVASELLQEIDGVRHSVSPRCRGFPAPPASILAQAYAESSGVGSQAVHRNLSGAGGGPPGAAVGRPAPESSCREILRRSFLCDGPARRSAARRSQASVVEREPHPHFVDRQRGEGVAR